MSDPIAGMVLNIIHGAVGSGGYKDADYIEDRVKEIRQQIGREFIGTFEVWTNNPDGESLMELMVKFFQLEEDNES